MRNTLKAATLESKFPLLAVEADCIISKDADITAVFEVELPELFTVTAAEYEAIHAAWQSRYCPIIRWYINRTGLSGRITAARRTRKI